MRTMLVQLGSVYCVAVKELKSSYHNPENTAFTIYIPTMTIQLILCVYISICIYIYVYLVVYVMYAYIYTLRYIPTVAIQNSRAVCLRILHLEPHSASFRGCEPALWRRQNRDPGGERL